MHVHAGHHLLGAFETGPTPVAFELLEAVTDEDSADHDAKQCCSGTHANSLLSYDDVFPS
jgi:hypothetical protein